MQRQRTGFYTFVRFLVWIIYRCLFGIKAQGLENFPEDQNIILYGNHFSAWDPLTIAHIYRIGEVHFMAKDSLFRHKLLARLLEKLHAFPVNRGQRDMGAMRRAMQVLQDGHVLGIFPEGTRRHEDGVSQIETGVAVMALKSGVPLVPVLMGGKYRPFGKLRAIVGKPIDLSDLREMRADAQVLEAVKTRLVDGLENLRPLLSNEAAGKMS